MKEYRVLYGEAAANEDQINQLAREGFSITIVVSGSERHGLVLYMERDTAAVSERVVLTDEKNNIMHVIGNPL